MSLLRSSRTYFAVTLLLGAVPLASACAQQKRPCDPDNAGLTLPAGFCATVFAEKVGGPRHGVVAPNGDLIVNVQPSGSGDNAVNVAPGGGVYVFSDTNGDGKADRIRKIGDAANTGIALANGAIYASGRDVVVRYLLKGDSLVAAGPVDTIIQGLPTAGHRSHNFVVEGSVLYLNVGSRTNSCQVADRQNKSPGADPCVELDGRAGLWTFDANNTHQTVADGHHFAIGIRNAVGLTRNPIDGTIYTMMHGRDQLAVNWGFTNEYSAENPAEEFLRVNDGDDFGWPYCYYSNEEKKLVLAPEYGGDGKQTGRCATKKLPVYAFPGHWAPNASMFYTGAQFPATYRGGVFIAFHGSWNRAPLPQAGFKVVYLPIENGAASGAPQTFADGFQVAPSADKAFRNGRPTGLAQGTDGSLFVMDDGSGRIWKISYVGN